jgi:hypothetical protein
MRKYYVNIDVDDKMSEKTLIDELNLSYEHMILSMKEENFFDNSNSEDKYKTITLSILPKG